MTIVQMLNPFKGKKVEEAPDEHIDIPLEEKMPLSILWQKEVPVLTPAQIRTFYEQYAKEYSDNRFWVFVQKSYDAGYNSFVLPCAGETHGPNDVAVRGTPQRPLELTILGSTGSYWCNHMADANIIVKGDVGRHFAESTKNVDVKIEGDARFGLGGGTAHSRFSVEGDAETNCGERSLESTFVINGNVEGVCGYDSVGSRFIIHGTVDQLAGSSAYDVYGGVKEINQFASRCTIRVPAEQLERTIALAKESYHVYDRDCVGPFKPIFDRGAEIYRRLMGTAHNIEALPEVPR